MADNKYTQGRIRYQKRMGAMGTEVKNTGRLRSTFGTVARGPLRIHSSIKAEGTLAYIFKINSFSTLEISQRLAIILETFIQEKQLCLYKNSKLSGIFICSISIPSFQFCGGFGHQNPQNWSSYESQQPSSHWRRQMGLDCPRKPGPQGNVTIWP